jgi:hypothetical protein
LTPFPLLALRDLVWTFLTAEQLQVPSINPTASGFLPARPHPYPFFHPEDSVAGQNARISFVFGTFARFGLTLPKKWFPSPGYKLTHGERGQTDHSSLIGTIRIFLPSKIAASSSHFRFGLPVKTGGRVGIVLGSQVHNTLMRGCKVKILGRR